MTCSLSVHRNECTEYVEPALSHMAPQLTSTVGNSSIVETRIACAGWCSAAVGAGACGAVRRTRGTSRALVAAGCKHTAQSEHCHAFTTAASFFSPVHTGGFDPTPVHTDVPAAPEFSVQALSNKNRSGAAGSLPRSSWVIVYTSSSLKSVA